MKRKEKLEMRRDLIHKCKVAKEQIEQLRSEHAIKWRLDGLAGTLREFREGIDQKRIGGISSYKHFQKYYTQKFQEVYDL